MKDFTFYSLEGKQISLSKFKSKWILLDFWFIGCSPCHEAIPELRKLQAEFKNCLEIVGINPRDNIEKVLKYTEKYELDWNFYSAKHDSNIKPYFNISGYPTYFLIDPDGNFRLIPTNFEFSNIKKEISEIIKSDCD